MIRARRAFTLLAAAFVLGVLAAGCGGGSDGGAAGEPDPGRVTLTFLAEIAGEPFACGRTFAGIGTTSATIEPGDLRFYVSEVRLVRDDGSAEPVVLDTDGRWQLDDVALLDFEDATGRCSFAGTPERNESVRGAAAPGEYVGVRFAIGVPFARNHGDAATAPPPLDETALFWNWNAGYKFLLHDSFVQGSGNEFRMHLGSTRCDGDGRGNVTGCGNPNRVAVELTPFDPRRDAIVADLASLFAASDVEQNAAQTPPGCMGSPADDDCAAPFERLGLPFGGRPGGVQRLFAVAPGRARPPEPTSPAPTPTPAGGPTPPGEGYVWNLPPGFPVPLVPDDNPMSAAKVELGRHLFHDTRLSRSGTQSCASCHQQARAFTDARETALGSTGEAHPRNAQGLANVAYAPTLTWMNPNLARLEQQLLIPLFGEEPVELGFAGREDELLARLGNEALYRDLFAAAFPGENDPIGVANLGRAIASFERTLISGHSAYDRYVYQHDDDALDEPAKRGMALFFSEFLECDHCHGGVTFASALTHEGNPRESTPFENNGLFNVGGTGAYPEPNTGLFAFTGAPRDMGRMKPPSLRNVALTAPYMHDGSIATLAEVVDHYARGGRRIESGPLAGDGALNPNKSQFITGFPLTEQAKADLLAFLDSLTDHDFVADPRFADPFAPEPAPRP